MYAEHLLPPRRKGGKRGVLESERFRAARLVVDTGIHHFGWTADEAEDYLLTYGFISEEEARSEVLRYASEPGQALGYHYGKTVFSKIAEVVPSLPSFHSKVLRAGSVPVSYLLREYLPSRSARSCLTHRR